jgi:hypothetical protein
MKSQRHLRAMGYVVQSEPVLVVIDGQRAIPEVHVEVPRDLISERRGNLRRFTSLQRRGRHRRIPARESCQLLRDRRTQPGGWGRGFPDSDAVGEIRTRIPGSGAIVRYWKTPRSRALRLSGTDPPA